MNELLGWYGCDKLSSGEAQNLSLKALRHFTPTSSTSPPPPQTSDSSPGTSRHEDISDGVTSDGEISRDGIDRGTPLLDVESETPSTGSGTILCAWCLKNGLKLFTLKTADGETKAFCSEPCFNQCRRAAFKKNRICDWCKHVRHTVNYVDFQDGEHQLQFCSDKCLNQYKMNIFCKETQAYLQMHPHLQDSINKLNNSGSKSNLITPDLWLRDCKESANGNHSMASAQSDDENYASQATSCNSSELEDLSLQSKAVKLGNNTEQKEIKSMYNHFKVHNLNNSMLNDQKGNHIDYKNLLNSVSGNNDEKQDRKRKHRTYDKHIRKSERKPYQILKVSDLDSTISQPSVAYPSSLQQITEKGKLSSLSPPIPTSYNPINGSSTPTSSKFSPLIPPGPALPVGLPPPPPLLHGDLLHPHFFSSSNVYQQPTLNLLAQQQQLDLYLRMQSAMGIRPSMQNTGRTVIPDHLSHISATQNITHHQPISSPSSLIPPMMVPYPLIVPLPVPIPIPIPIPLSKFLTMKTDLKKNENKICEHRFNRNNEKDEATNCVDRENERVNASPPDSSSAGSLNNKDSTKTYSNCKLCPVSSSESLLQNSMKETDVLIEKEHLCNATVTRSKSKHGRHTVSSDSCKRQRLVSKHEL